tara:strand:+ start:28065 stop:29120 length:1056 start_codon:yes stop_codon:yes gene_type:complete
MNSVEDVIKKYGDGVVLSGNMVLEEKKDIISWSPALDIILGGGVPDGSWVTLTGEPKCGKTTSALHFAAKAQKQFKRNVYYLNIEGRLKPRDLEGIKDLDLDNVKVIGSYFDDKENKGRILSAEEYLTIGENFIKNDPGCILIIDSISQLITEKEITGAVHDQHRAPGAKLVSSFCRRVSNVLPVNKNIIIAITHQIANISGYGKSKVESGGRKIAYAVDVKLEAKRVQPWYIGSEEDAPIGQIVTWLTHSTAIIAPGQKIDSYLRYGYGIDEVTEIIRLGIDTGFITKAGSWLTCSFMEDHLKELGVKEWDDDAKKLCRVQGQEKMKRLLTENPSWFDILDSEIKKMLVR